VDASNGNEEAGSRRREEGEVRSAREGRGEQGAQAGAESGRQIQAPARREEERGEGGKAGHEGRCEACAEIDAIETGVIETGAIEAGVIEAGIEARIIEIRFADSGETGQARESGKTDACNEKARCCVEADSEIQHD
jgi:hypothetical protein